MLAYSTIILTVPQRTIRLNPKPYVSKVGASMFRKEPTLYSHTVYKQAGKVSESTIQILAKKDGPKQQPSYLHFLLHMALFCSGFSGVKARGSGGGARAGRTGKNIHQFFLCVVSFFFMT